MNLAARTMLQEFFVSEISKVLKSGKRLNIGVVGGSKRDPELHSLKSLGVEFKLTLYGIEACDVFLDLNKDNEIFSEHDLVLCSQVLEHVWLIDAAFENLSNLVAKGGLLWVACPASNMKHGGGSTEYFSAGYQPQLIENYLKKYNFEILCSKDFGSKRFYYMTHRLQDWPSIQEYINPLKRRISKSRVKETIRSFRARKYFELIKQIIENFIINSWDEEIVFSSKFSTETFVLARKLEKKEM